MEEINIHGEEVATVSTMGSTFKEVYASLSVSDLETYLKKGAEASIDKPKRITRRDTAEQSNYGHITYHDSTVGTSNWGKVKPYGNKKSKFKIDELIETFKELQHKDIGDIYLTGSVGLYLQKKLDRDEFKDLDIVLVGKLELDDDMKEHHRGDYPKDDQCEERKSVIFNNIPIDIFVVKKPVNKVVVTYEGTEIVCQHYKDIIQAKLNMALNKLKDKDYLLNNCIDIKIL